MEVKRPADEHSGVRRPNQASNHPTNQPTPPMRDAEIDLPIRFPPSSAGAKLNEEGRAGGGGECVGKRRAGGGHGVERVKGREEGGEIRGNSVCP